MKEQRGRFARLSRTGLRALPLLAALVAAPAAWAQVTPSQVYEALAPGQSVNVDKRVQTPEIPPNPDIVFLADTTGSMGGAIANVIANATAVMNTVKASQSSAQFGVAEYRDRGDIFVWQLNQNLTPTVATAQGAINTWNASGGGDFPEGQMVALTQIATAINWRPGSTRILVWFGDAPGHDPRLGFTEIGATAALVGQNIRVIAIPTGFAQLDSTGQATRITNATMGCLLPNANDNQVSAAILAGLMSLPVTVIPQAVGCDPLSVSFNPPSRTVTSGTAATFVETITAPNDPGWCDDVHCTVEFRVENGNLIGTQEIWVTALDVTPPTVNCPEDLVVECDGEGNLAELADWLAGFSASDNCPGEIDIDGPNADAEPGPGPGTTTYTYTATDAAGNENSCSATFTIEDTTAPDVTVGPAGSMWPPNHKYRTFSLSDCGVTIEDICDGTLDVNSAGTITSISSDEPENVTGKGDGNTVDDIVILGASSFKLRSERQGGSNGRVYTIHFDVTDGSENVTSASCQIGVPHDQSGAPAVDDGAAAGYTVVP